MVSTRQPRSLPPHSSPVLCLAFSVKALPTSKCPWMAARATLTAQFSITTSSTSQPRCARHSSRPLPLPSSQHLHHTLAGWLAALHLRDHWSHHCASGDRRGVHCDRSSCGCVHSVWACLHRGACGGRWQACSFAVHARPPPNGCQHDAPSLASGYCYQRMTSLACTHSHTRHAA